MALPQQVVERLGREPTGTPGWSSRLLMFAGTLFFISIAVYLGLEFGYKPYLSSQVGKLNDQIQRFTQEIPVNDQNNLISFYSQISNLNGILNQHVVSSPLFDWLEKNTENQIYYTKLDFTPSTGQLTLMGFSKTVNDFSQQLQVFQSDPGVDRININNFAFTQNGSWQFDETLFLNNRLFNQASSSLQ